MINEMNKGIQKLSESEESNVAGGMVIKVNPKDLKSQGIDLKPYLVINDETGKIVDSFNSYSDAVKFDSEHNDSEQYIWKLSGSEVEEHIFKKLDDSGYVFKY